MNKEKPEKIISLERLLPHAGGSVFRLARMAMIRASEIHFGSVPLVDHQPLDKETTIALREISQGELSLRTGQKCSDKGQPKGGKE